MSNDSKEKQDKDNLTAKKRNFDTHCFLQSWY